MPLYYNGFVGDPVAAAILVPLAKPGAVVTTYGDKELSAQLSSLDESWQWTYQNRQCKKLIDGSIEVISIMREMVFD
jgi:hypothetical protein